MRAPVGEETASGTFLEQLFPPELQPSTPWASASDTPSSKPSRLAPVGYPSDRDHPRSSLSGVRPVLASHSVSRAATMAQRREHAGRALTDHTEGMERPEPELALGGPGRAGCLESERLVPPAR